MPADLVKSVENVERQLATFLTAEKRLRKNENIVRRAKNGDLSFETVRTESIPRQDASTRPSANFYTETPDSAQIGQQIGSPQAPSSAVLAQPPEPQVVVPEQVPTGDKPCQTLAADLSTTTISIHE